MSNEKTPKPGSASGFFVIRHFTRENFRSRASSFLLSPCNGGNDADLVGFFYRGCLFIQETDVLVIEEDVHETAHVAAFVTDALFQAGMVLFEIGDDFIDVRAGGRDELLLVRQLAQRGWDTDGCHGIFWVGF